MPRGFSFKLVYFQGELDSTKLSFQMSASGEGGEIFLETKEVVSEIVDNQTIRHRFNPDTYGIFNVDCRREKKWTGDSPPGSGIDTVMRDGSTYVKLGFCPQRIFVGCKFLPMIVWISATLCLCWFPKCLCCPSLIFQWADCTRV